MSLLKGENFKNFVFIILNIFCVTFIVLVVKLLFQAPHHFTYANALMAIHFAVTSLCLFACNRARVYEIKRVPMNDIVKLSLSQVASVAFVNYSLMYNSVGLYQLLKLVNIPVVCVIEYFWQGKTYSADIKTSLFVLLLGVGMTTITEPPKQFSWIGFTHGMVATVATAIYQILCNDYSKRHEANGMQMLHWQAPVSALMFAVLSLATDNTREMFTRVYTGSTLRLVFLSGLVAFGVNLTVFMIINRTSPVTYQVVGHVKTTLVLVFGFILFSTVLDWRNIGGIVLAMVGIIWYTHIKLKSAPAPAKKVDVPEPDATELAEIEQPAEPRDRNV